MRPSNIELIIDKLEIDDIEITWTNSVSLLYTASNPHGCTILIIEILNNESNFHVVIQVPRTFIPQQTPSPTIDVNRMYTLTFDKLAPDGDSENLFTTKLGIYNENQTVL